MKAQKLKLQAIQKEQHQLVQIEQILKDLVGKVNESINELKVEELELKSNLVEVLTSNIPNDDDQPTTSAQAVTRSQLTTTDLEENDSEMNQEGIENINKQMLALESLLVPMQQRKFNYEEEEEDDDDDVINEDLKEILQQDQEETDDDYD